jgi:ABC-2 type transport system permease protein/lipopolysaccharide transport system permease protein
VLYPLRLVVPGNGRALYAVLFPPGALIDQMRETLFHATTPAAGVTLLASLGTAIYLAAGFLYFKRLETGFADVS